MAVCEFDIKCQGRTNVTEKPPTPSQHSHSDHHHHHWAFILGLSSMWIASRAERRRWFQSCGTERDRKENCFQLLNKSERKAPSWSSTNSEDDEKFRKNLCCSPFDCEPEVRTNRSLVSASKLRLNGNLISWGYGSLDGFRVKSWKSFPFNIILEMRASDERHIQSHMCCEHSCEYCHVHIIGLHTIFLSLARSFSVELRIEFFEPSTNKQRWRCGDVR